jgi:hypothetical protein
MVGAINPNTSTPLTTQQRLARNSAYMLNPGEPFPAEASQPASPPPPSKHGLAPGAIAGIALAALGLVVLAALLFFVWGRAKALGEEVSRKESSVARRVSSSLFGLAQLGEQKVFDTPYAEVEYGTQRYVEMQQAYELDLAHSPTAGDVKLVVNEGGKGSPAPPYGWHVNGEVEPVEMDGCAVGGGGRERARWAEGGGEGGEGKMF